MSNFRVEKPACIERDMARHALLEASAGTGKTYVIERLVVEMLLEWNIPIERVLVVTFTRRAAAEMATRIRQCIEDLLAGKGATTKKSATCWVIDTAARRRLEQALADFDQAPISTIHTFCQRVLDEQEILTGRLREAAPTDLFSLFHEAFTGSLREVAGQASLATEVLREWLCGQKVEQLEALLFKHRTGLANVRPLVNDARLETLRVALLDALEAPLPDEVALEDAGVDKHVEAYALYLGELAAFARRHAKSQARTFQLGFVRLTRECLAKDKDLDGLADLSGVKGKPRSLLAAIAALYAELPSADALALHTFLPGVLERFETLCRLRGGVDFDRLLIETHRALEDDAQHLLRDRLRSRYEAVLVDEFQDTDETQWRILRAAFVADQSPTRFVAVGDPKQAIYSFRGGDLATYLLARDGDGRKKRSLEEVDKLSDNWRSTPEMVKAYNLLLTTADEDGLFLGPESEGVVYEPVKAAGNVGALLRDGREERPFGLLRVQETTIGAGVAVVRAAIVQQAKALLDGSARIRLAEGETRPVQPSDLMVLVDNNPYARQFVRDLNAAGIPAEQYRAAGLMGSPEAEEVCDLLSALCRPEEPGAMLQALRTLFFDVALDDLETANALPATDERIEQWHGLVRAAQGRRWVELFSRLRTSAGMLRRKAFNAQTERELLTLHAVLDTAHQIARDGCADIAMLAQRVKSLFEVSGKDEQDDDDIYPASEGPSAVRVLTVFKAKGLEAPIVFLATGPKSKAHGHGGARPYHEGKQRLLWVGDCRLRPEAQRIEREADLEARRFQYVALTRAKYQLWLPYLLKVPSATERQLKPYASAGPHYRAINERLFQLLEAQPNKAFSELCRLEPGPFEALPEQAPLPPPKRPPPQPHAPKPEPRLVREQARALSIASFSSLELPFDGLPEKPAGSKPKDTELAKGAGAGRAIHALLEDVPLEATKPGQRYEAWLAHPKVKRLLDAWWARQRQRKLDSNAEARIDHQQRLVFHALHDAMPLPGGATVQGLGTLDGFQREVPFDLPWPSAANPFGAQRAGRWTVDRGFLTGIIDFTFERDGRAYFGDWKSNCLERYDVATLEQSVRASYWGQVLIYSLALCRLHGIHTEQDYAARFGGALYVYLRGLGTPGEGACALKPSWDQLRKLDATLRAWSLDADARPRLSLLPNDAPAELDEDDDEDTEEEDAA